MRALTLTQPWATAILSMGKDIENRPIAPRCIAPGERFAIHAGLKVDDGDTWGIRHLLGQLPADLPKGAIVGTVELVGWVRCVTPDPDNFFDTEGLSDEQLASVLASPWRARASKCAWLLRAPRVLRGPIPFKGSQGIWTVPADIEAQIFAQEQQS